MAITKNASVRTIFAAAIMCIVLSFLSPVMALLQTIPSCVMGGVCLTLYGFIAVSGLKMFKDIDLGENKNLFVVSVILIAGIGGLSLQIPYHLSGSDVVTEVFVNGVFNGKLSSTVSAGTVDKAITVTSIATALILGIVTYAVIGKMEKKHQAEENEPESLIAGAVAPEANFEIGAEKQDD